ncbi:MAG TPA: 50S ribosomal protein L21e [Thermoplasmata archaeon]|jgi:large subunit ribosomal protein L21e|nr:50S ribosomal protein L21e [Thermoplasmata archaeon]
MVKASKGIMEKTRQKFRRSPRERGLSPITRSLQTFSVGDKAVIIIDGSKHKGWPHHRFHGLTGTVVERRGRAYVLDVRFGGKIKQAIALPEHLRKA